MATESTIRAATNEETDDIPAGEDHELVRVCWHIDKCPREADCSQPSFKKARTWSYESEEQSRCYLMRHLVHSSLHGCTEHEAEFEALEATVQSYEETFEDREAERRKNHLQAQGNNRGRRRRSRSRNRDDSWGPKQPIGRPPQARAVDLQLAHSSSAPSIIDMSTAVSAGSAGSCVSLTQQHSIENKEITFRLSHVRIIHDALVRAATATEQLEKIMEQFRTQYKHEQKVLKEAKELLGQYLTQ
jgi:hypothetical protein